MKATIPLALLILLHVNSLGYAHGEDKPGPHGGIIRMPGAFHTEVIQEGTSRFKVYLLDATFGHATVENSTVEGTLIAAEGRVTPVSCKPQRDFFLCTIDQPNQMSKARSLRLLARRMGVSAAFADYPMDRSLLRL